MKHPLIFLEKIYQPYVCYTDADPEAPENARMVNVTLIGQSTSDIRKKIAKICDFEMNLLQLVDIVFFFFFVVNSVIH